MQIVSAKHAMTTDFSCIPYPLSTLFTFIVSLERSWSWLNDLKKKKDTDLKGKRKHVFLNFNQSVMLI